MAFDKLPTIKGYKCSQSSIADNEKNYYALMISILKGYTIDYSLMVMGISNPVQPYNRKKLGKYTEIATLSYVLHYFCGMTRNEVSNSLGKSWDMVRNGINYAKGFKRERRFESKITRKFAKSFVADELQNDEDADG